LELLGSGASVSGGPWQIALTREGDSLL
jgi:hypothetical protein